MWNLPQIFTGDPMTVSVDDQSIFEAARRITSPEDRQAFLREKCGDDHVLLQHLQALIKAFDEHQSFLETPPSELVRTVDADAANEHAGTIIGPYKLLQQIGEGGMGVVYMAEQNQPVHRKVALKIIKPGMDSKQVIARFEAERQALAMMDHVNIARVIDGGTTESGRPYFVMELINGVPITKYCDDNHLTPRERLELFVPVCQAIQHAHQKGIIHRDIKPSNVLVTIYEGKPVPKVIDFGVAKAIDQKLTEHTLCTNFGIMVGTLEYMSPEQAEMSALGVDTRSDIYSLGVLLYELLTGSTPLTKQQMKDAAYVELLRLLKDVDPPKPSTRLSESGDNLASISAMRKMEPAKLTKLVRGELDWIVMKPLEKDRNRRYETTSAFAEDIQHYLRYEPVKACPPSTWYRLSKFTRRYKVPILITAMVILALMISTADSLYQMFEAKKARALADERLVKEKDALKLALAAVDQMLTQVADVTVRGIPQMEQVRLKLLQDAAAFYQQLLTKRTEDPEIRCEVAIASFRLGEMYLELGQPSQARMLYKETERILNELVSQSPDDTRFRVELARFYNRLSWQATIPEPVARSYHTRAIELVKPIIDSHPADYQIRNETLRTTLADSYRIMAAAQIRKDNLNEIEKKIREAMTLCKDDSGHGQFVLGHCYRVLGTIEETRKNKSKQLEYLKKALTVFEDIIAQGSTSTVYRWELCNGLQGYGYCLYQAGQFREAETIMQRGVDMREQMAKDFPSSQLMSGQRIWSRAQLAEVYCAQHKYDKAVAEFKRAEETPGGGGTIPWTDNIKINETPPPEPTSHLPSWHHYKRRADAYFHLKEYDKALADLALALELKPTDLSTLSWIPPDAVARCPDVAFRKGFLAWIEKLITQSEGKNGQAYIVRGLIYGALGQTDEANKSFCEALQLNPNDPILNNNLAWYLTTSTNAKSRYPNRAIVLAKKAVELAPNDGICWNTLGVAQYRMQDWKAAISALEKSLELLPSHKSFNWFFLAMAHWQLGNKVEARKYYDQAVEWMDKYMPQDEELIRFRAEASELMKLKEKITTSK